MGHCLSYKFGLEQASLEVWNDRGNVGAWELTRPCHGLGHETFILLHDHSCIGPGMCKPDAATGGTVMNWF